MINFLHTFTPQPILLQIGFLKIHWYGFLIALGAVLGFLSVLYWAKKYRIDKNQIYNLTFYLVIFGLIGDRLYYVIYAWDYYSKNLLDIFKIWQGGLAIFGALTAGLIVLFIYSKRHQLNFYLLLDIFVLAVALGLAFGRWGNYFNQELFGRPTDWPWGIPIEPANRPAGYENFQFFQPTFLYESLAMFLVFAILNLMHYLRQKTNKIKNGLIALAFFTLYFLERFLNEFLRLDYSPYILGWRVNQLISLLALAVCVIIWLGSLSLVYKNYISGRGK